MTLDGGMTADARYLCQLIFLFFSSALIRENVFEHKLSNRLYQ